MLTAHSGCEGTPMNSMEYVKKAVSIRPDALEVDIRRSEGVLVLDHGQERRALPAGKALGISQESGEEAQITLEDCLRQIKDTGLYLNADLKEPGLEKEVLAAASGVGFDRSRIIFTGCIGEPKSMVWRVKPAAVYANPEEFDCGFYERVMSLTGTERISYLERVLEIIHQLGYNVINVNYRVCDKDMIHVCIENNLKLSLWTIDEAEEAKRLCELAGRDRIVNLTTNRPTKISAE